MSQGTITTRVRAVGTIAVPVTDPDRAIEFYVGILGLEKRRDGPLPDGGRWIEVAPLGAATTIALAPAVAAPAGVDTGIRLLADDAEVAHRDLEQAGVRVGEVLRWPGVPPMFELRDPDRNTLYLVEAAGD